MKPEFTEVNEQSRVYIYAKDGNTVELAVENIVKFAVGKSGTHRLEDRAGNKYIMAPGWLAISIDMEGDWTL